MLVSKYNNLYCYFNRTAKCGGCWDEDIHNTLVKVLVRQVGSFPICGIDTKGYAVLNSAFMIVPFRYNSYAIMGLINSKLLKFFWSHKFEDKRKTFPKIKGSYLELLPIPTFSDDTLSECVRQIHSHIENGEPYIDKLLLMEKIVYHLYDLTYDEIKIIDPDTPITREEYKKNNNT